MMKSFFKTVFWIVLLGVGLFWAEFQEARAGNPAPLFNQPVKLDGSGRPLYNSWQRQERQRRKRRPVRSGEDKPVSAENAEIQETVDADKSTAATRAAGTSAVPNTSGSQLSIQPVKPVR